MLTISVRTLRHDLRIAAPDEAAAAALRFMQARPTVADMPAEPVDIAVERRYGFLHVRLPDGTLCEGTAQAVLNELHGLHFNLTRGEFPEAALLHGGCLSFADGHAVVIGDKAAGKTTLLTYLATSGWPVCGDEHVVLLGGEAMPRPRSLRIKGGTLAYLPQAARQHVLTAPFVTDWQGAPIYAVEPSALGVSWVLHRRPIRDLVFLTGNHGGRSRLRSLGFDDAIARLLPNTILPDRARAKTFAQLAGVVRGARCWELRNGQLDHAEECLYSALHSQHKTGPYFPDG